MTQLVAVDSSGFSDKAEAVDSSSGARLGQSLGLFREKPGTNAQRQLLKNCLGDFS